MVSLAGVGGTMNFSPGMRTVSPTMQGGQEEEQGATTPQQLTTDDECADDHRLLLTSNPHVNIIQPTPLAQSDANSGMIFKPLSTMSFGVSILVAGAGIFIIAIAVPIECNASNHECYIGIRPLSLLVYLHCMFWGFALICDQCVQYQHIKLRRRGYLEFYSDMRTLSQLPFWVVSTWSTLLLTVTTILHDHCHNEENCGKSIRLKKSEYVTVCIGIEFGILLVVVTLYLTRVWNFNRRKDYPDVLREDLMTSSTLGLEFNSQLQSVRAIDEEIYERQADMIRYYKEHNSMLRKTVLELSRQLNIERARNNF